MNKYSEYDVTCIYTFSLLLIALDLANTVECSYMRVMHLGEPRTVLTSVEMR